MRGCQAAKHFALVGFLKEFIDVFDKICHRTPPNSRRRSTTGFYRRQTLSIRHLTNYQMNSK